MIDRFTEHATLPEDMEENTISSMFTGETAYTVPWAMWSDSERHLWLHPEMSVDPNPGGTVQMRIEKREDGYHVWPPSDARYTTSNGPGNDTEYIPVVELHR